MQKYRRVTYVDRCQIYWLLGSEKSVSEIATELNFNKSTIYRELKRNSKGLQYQPDEAECQANTRQITCKRKYKVDGSLEAVVVKLLEKKLSPDQISGRIKQEKGISLTQQTIYNYIWQRNPGLAVYLRRHGRRGAGRYLQRKHLKSKKRSIHLRPEIVNKRGRFGDWERDGMYVAKRQQLLVFTERKSRYLRLVPMGTGRPKVVTKLTEKLIKSIKRKSYTMTNDNGPEFRDSMSLSIKAYHCDPEKPQQRGTVENTIGLLRQYIKRDTDITYLTRKKLKAIEDQLNLRPRRCLDYKTPYEVFYGKKVALAT